MFGIIAKGQKCAMYSWMQSFDASAHHLGKTRDLGYIDGLYPGITKRGGSATRADNLDAKVMQARREFNQSLLV
jgi:hypothetical protein